jgi:ribosome biogenesis GTPase A
VREDALAQRFRHRAAVVFFVLKMWQLWKRGPTPCIRWASRSLTSRALHRPPQTSTEVSIGDDDVWKMLENIKECQDDAVHRGQTRILKPKSNPMMKCLVRTQRAVADMDAETEEEMLLSSELMPSKASVPVDKQRICRVCLLGSPNAGKSTLSNALIESKLSAVSRKRNTTRHELRGVITRGEAQLVIVDTPGIVPIEGMRR